MALELRMDLIGIAVTDATISSFYPDYRPPAGNGVDLFADHGVG
ncbi:hypothetical protein [Natronosporangium hydrolyticum]|nr:hypothetical protein [Natronosporangium hydrolyticum]